MTPRDDLNQEALKYPKPGDYWHERFCPYFLVVRVNGDEYTVLNCLYYHGKSAKINIDQDHWGFDFDKAITVNHAWIEQAVRYKSYDGFVADVIRSPKFIQLADEWRIHKAAKLRKEWKDLTGWTELNKN